jgi:long-chain acyl-CoA synthetase
MTIGEPMQQRQSAACADVRANTVAVSWTIGGLLRTLATQEYHSAVVAFSDGGPETWDSATLADHARRLACGLQLRGIARGDPVALWAANSPVWIISALAILTAGGMLVPIDDLAEPDAVAAMLKSCNARLVITTRRHRDASDALWRTQGIGAILIDENQQSADNATPWRSLLREPCENLPDPAGDEPALLS